MPGTGAPIPFAAVARTEKVLNDPGLTISDGGFDDSAKYAEGS